MQKRFSILSLLELTAVVAVILAADRAMMAVHGLALLSGLVFIGGSIGTYAAFRLRPSDTFESTVKTARWTAAVVTAVNAIAVLLVAFDRLQLTRSEVEWIWVLIPIAVAMVTIVGTAWGMAAAMVAAIYFSKW